MDPVNKILGVKCFNCGETTPRETAKRWYHGDQDDLVCPDCAKKLKHTDTGFRGMRVDRT